MNLLKVTLLTYTPEPEKIVAAAARCCYSNDDPNNLLEEMTDEKAAKFLQKLTNLGHQSLLSTCHLHLQSAECQEHSWHKLLVTD